MLYSAYIINTSFAGLISAAHQTLLRWAINRSAHPAKFSLPHRIAHPGWSADTGSESRCRMRHRSAGAAPAPARVAGFFCAIAADGSPVCGSLNSAAIIDPRPRTAAMAGTLSWHQSACLSDAVPVVFARSQSDSLSIMLSTACAAATASGLPA